MQYNILITIKCNAIGFRFHRSILTQTFVAEKGQIQFAQASKEILRNNELKIKKQCFHTLPLTKNHVLVRREGLGVKAKRLRELNETCITGTDEQIILVFH